MTRNEHHSSFFPAAALPSTMRPLIAHRGWRFTFDAVVLMLLALSFLGYPASGRAQGDAQYFPETGHTVRGLFLAYWQQNGALAQQGYPLTEELSEQSALDGQTYSVQYFERAVFEAHPANQPPYNVLLTQLGTLRYQARYGNNGAAGQQPRQDNARVFPETGHNLGGRFREYWEQHGGLAQQGYPISDEFTEVSDLNGLPYRVQYFERAVFEYHPENQPPYDVLLAQLGRFHLVVRQARAAAAQLPSPLRIYDQGPRGGDWPSDAGSKEVSYATCGTSAPALPGRPTVTTCQASMLLITKLAPAGAGFDVTFAASWESGQKSHSWKLRVSGDGQVSLRAETGDPLPLFPI